MKSFLRSIYHKTLSYRYRLRYNNEIDRLITKYGTRIKPVDSISPSASRSATLNELKKVLPQETKFIELNLDEQKRVGGLKSYFQKHSDLYLPFGNAREKSIEHALTFELFEMNKIKRHCDVAASKSPIEGVFKRDYPGIEYWKQDLIYTTDLEKKVVGGFAQNMKEIPDGFFNSLSLHCSFEHFTGSSDSEFVQEVNRVLAPGGTCFIVPLYMDLESKIYFDPTMNSEKAVADFDRESTLCPTFQYKQEHGRYYSPQTLKARIFNHLPKSLDATIVCFQYDEQKNSDLYLKFGLLLRKTGS